MKLYEQEVMIGFQEIPNEVSLLFPMTGCPLRCKGCHSTHLQNPNLGELLTTEKLKEYIEKYSNVITAIVFFGGDWDSDGLYEALSYIKSKTKLKTCLYTGFLEAEKRIKDKLDYLKVGPYVESLGGITSKNTNQVFYKKENENWVNITYLMNGGENG